MVPEILDPDDAPVDPYLIAGKLAKGSILAYHTALEFHGVAYSTYEKFTYLDYHTAKPFTFRNHLFQSIAFPRALCRKAKETFACDEIIRDGVKIRVTTLERTFVDILDKPQLSGGWEEIFPSLDMIGVLDIELFFRKLI